VGHPRCGFRARLPPADGLAVPAREARGLRARPDGKGKHKKHVDAAALRTRKEKFGRRFDDDREEDARMDREWAL
jgi:hypothetical protein